MTITIIGPGLIGGSIAIGLRANGFATRLIGVDSNPAHAAHALALGLVDAVLPLAEAIQESQIVVVATPVDSLVTLLPQVLDLVNEHQIVLDAGSTKGPALQAVAHHPQRARFVATHPMAGTEYSGPEAAIAEFLQISVACSPPSSERSRGSGRWPSPVSIAGYAHHYLDGAEHDLHVAYVSHISHIASFALALTVLEKEREEDRIFELASGGFSSTVRLAKSNPDTWIPIFRQNRDNVLDVLDEFINTISRFVRC